MLERPAPILVYDRLDANRRHILLLLAAFIALLLPLVCGAAVYLSFFAFIVTTADKPIDLSDPFRLQTRAEIIVFLSMALSLSVVIACGAHLYSSLSRLQHPGEPVRRDEEPELWRTIENLCIGAGLPLPALYVIETAALNAFVTGRDPGHASLAVTRGLLQLLDRRELAGVVAHGLSHIGNRDTALNILLATLVRTIGLPLTVVKGLNPARLADLSLGFVALFLLPAFYAVAFFAMLVSVVVWSALDRGASTRLWIAMLTPVYALLIGPGAAQLLRKRMSKERTCLADADAVLLTRDPEALALALAKIGAAGGAPMQTNVVTAEMYFVDPAGSTWGNTSPHTTIDGRIELLAKMGDGIPEKELARAVAAGIRYRALE
jgi:heat shock protein HtpX